MTGLRAAATLATPRSFYNAGKWAAALGDEQGAHVGRARAQAKRALVALGEIAELANAHPRVRNLAQSDFLDPSKMRAMRSTTKSRMKRRAGRLADIARGAVDLHGALRQVLARGGATGRAAAGHADAGSARQASGQLTTARLRRDWEARERVQAAALAARSADAAARQPHAPVFN